MNTPAAGQHGSPASEDREAYLERFPRQIRARPRSRAIGNVAAACVVAVVAIAAVSTQVATGDYFTAFITINVAGPLVLIALGAIPQTRQKRPFRFINALVMTRADRKPVDSWVHLAPMRRMRPATICAFLWFTLGATAVAISGFAQVLGVIPRQNEGADLSGLIIAGVLALVLAVAGWWFTWLMYSRNVRSETIGRRLAGISLGRSGIAVHVPGRDLEVSWEMIIGVDATILSLSRRSKTPMIRVHLDPVYGATGNAHYAPVDTIAVPPDAVYTALRWYLDHPEARWELGRTEGQQRLDTWRRTAIS